MDQTYMSYGSDPCFCVEDAFMLLMYIRVYVSWFVGMFGA